MENKKCLKPPTSIWYDHTKPEFQVFFLRLGRSPQAKWVIGPVSQVGPVI